MFIIVFKFLQFFQAPLSKHSPMWMSEKMILFVRVWNKFQLNWNKEWLEIVNDRFYQFLKPLGTEPRVPPENMFVFFRIFRWNFILVTSNVNKIYFRYVKKILVHIGTPKSESVYLFRSLLKMYLFFLFFLKISFHP